MTTLLSNEDEKLGDGRAVANWVLDWGDREGVTITNLAIQKIVYFCHVCSLVELNKPLIVNRFEAWEYGPVLPHLFRDFKPAGSKPIQHRARQLNRTSGEMEVVEPRFDHETAALLEKTVPVYGRLSASDLVSLSHLNGGPWHKAWHHESSVNIGMKITDQEILGFYIKEAGNQSLQ